MVGVGNVVQNDGNIFEILGIVVRGGIISTLGCIGCLGVVGSLAGSSGATDFFFIISPPKKYNYLADSRMIAGIVQKPKF